MSQYLLYSNILMWISIVFLFFLVFLLYRQFGTVYLSKGDSIDRDGIPVGNTIGYFEGISYKTGDTITLDSLSEKPMLMTFISPNCGPCKDLMVDWNKACAEYGDQINFVLVGLGSKNSFKRSNNFINIKSDLILDPHHQVAGVCNVRVTPYALFSDDKGEVLGKGLCNDMEKIKGLISTLNTEPSTEVLA